MMNRGKLTIVFILLMAVSAGSMAVWWQHNQQRRAMQFWGTDAAMLIRHAPEVGILKLGVIKETEKVDSPTIAVDGTTLFVIERKDISNLRGLVHARYALIEDASFDWNDTRKDCVEKWEYAFQFSENEKVATVLLDFECARVHFVEQNCDATLTKQIMNGMRKYSAGQMNQ